MLRLEIKAESTFKELMANAKAVANGQADFETTIEFALTNEKNEDDYGMHILMKNFLKYTNKDSKHNHPILQ